MKYPTLINNYKVLASSFKETLGDVPLNKAETYLYRKMENKLPYKFDISISNTYVIDVTVHINEQIKEDLKKVDNNVRELLLNIFGIEKFESLLAPYVFIKEDYPENISFSFDKIKIMPYIPMSFHGIHKLIKECSHIYIPSGEHYITDSVLGLLKINGLRSFSTRQNTDQKWIDIIHKHLAHGKDIVACSEELIENNLKEYAKL